jgi:hypothetical protein
MKKRGEKKVDLRDGMYCMDVVLGCRKKLVICDRNPQIPC